MRKPRLCFRVRLAPVSRVDFYDLWSSGGCACVQVLPVMQHDGRFIRAWELLDHISAEQFVEVGWGHRSRGRRW